MASGSRALPDLVSRIRVDSSGVDQAVTSLISSFGKADLALAGVAAGLGLLVLGGKNMLDIYERHTAALSGLKQAVDSHNDSLSTQGRVVADVTREQRALEVATNNSRMSQMAYTDAVRKHGAHSEQAIRAGLHLRDANIGVANAQDALRAAQAKNTAGTQQQAISYAKLQQQVDSFIKGNRSYISDQSQVVDGYAKLVRSGLDVTETQRVMNDAVDLAAIKHISLSDAVDVLNQAEHGRMRGLIDLGITTKQLTDADGNLLKGQQAVGAAMGEVDAKVKGGRNDITVSEQAWNRLNNDWQDMAQKAGPPLAALLDSILTKIDDAYTALDNFGKNNEAWAGISAHLTDIAQEIHDRMLVPLQAVWQYYSTGTLPSSPLSSSTGNPQKQTPAPGQGYQFNSAAASDPMPTTPPAAGYVWVHTPVGWRQVPKSQPTQNTSQKPQHRMSGGSLLPHQTYTVGEEVPETVVMGARGGYVIPNAGGGRATQGAVTINIHVASNADAADIASEVGWELRKLRRFA